MGRRRVFYSESPGRAAQERSGKGEDRIAVEAGKHYDIEMDCATVADGKLDECIELPRQRIEMSKTLSKVRTRFRPVSDSIPIAVTLRSLVSATCAAERRGSLPCRF